MGDEQQAVQCIQRRGNGNPQGRQPTQKRPRAPGWEGLRPGTSNFDPASEIEESCQQQSRAGPKRKGPRTPGGLGNRDVHAIGVAVEIPSIITQPESRRIGRRQSRTGGGVGTSVLRRFGYPMLVLLVKMFLQSITALDRAHRCRWLELHPGPAAGPRGATSRESSPAPSLVRAKDSCRRRACFRRPATPGAPTDRR